MMTMMMFPKRFKFTGKTIKADWRKRRRGGRVERRKKGEGKKCIRKFRSKKIFSHIK